MKSDGQHILFSIIMIYDSKNKLMSYSEQSMPLLKILKTYKSNTSNLPLNSQTIQFTSFLT